VPTETDNSSIGVSPQAVQTIDEAVKNVEELTGPGSLQARKIKILQTYNNFAKEISRAGKLEDLHRLLSAEEKALQDDARWMVEYSGLYRRLLLAEAKLDTVRSDVLRLVHERIAEFYPDAKLILPSSDVGERIAELVNQWAKQSEQLLANAASRYKRWRLRRRALDSLNKVVLLFGVLGLGFEIFWDYLHDFVKEHFPEFMNVLQNHWHGAPAFRERTISMVVLVIVLAANEFILRPLLEERLLTNQRKDFLVSLDQICLNHVQILCHIALMENSIRDYVVRDKKETT
jgi:hypothetical protein